MRIGAALSTDPDPATAAEAAVQGARSQIGGAEVSLAVVVVPGNTLLRLRSLWRPFASRPGPSR